ncbi:MAG: ester cyclase [Caldilineaceae bacterium]
MTQAENVTLVRRWIDEVWNQGDWERMADFHPAIFENEGKQSTLEDARLWHLHNRTTFPDIHYVIDDIFASEERVAVRWSATATHKGTLWNLIPPTGKTIRWNGMHMLRLTDGKIIEVWALQNSVAQLMQMGAKLSPASE